MKLLKGPTSRKDDVGITLRAPAGCARTADAVTKLAISAACPVNVAERVRTCIFHSGRYDCRISAGAAFYIVSQTAALKRVGATITITDRLAA